MDINEAMRRAKAAGWGGIAVWETWPGKFMGCLIKPDCELDLKTNLWEYTQTPQDALEQLVAKAEANLYN